MLLVLLLVIVIVFIFIAGLCLGKGQPTSGEEKPEARTIRCPSCGARARVRGNTWECGWCGDSGFIKTTKK